MSKQPVRPARTRPAEPCCDINSQRLQLLWVRMVGGILLPFSFRVFLSGVSSASRTFLSSVYMYAPTSIIGVSIASVSVGQRASWNDVGWWRIPHQMCYAKCGAMGVARSAATLLIQYLTRFACIPISAVTPSQTDCGSYTRISWCHL